LIPAPRRADTIDGVTPIIVSDDGYGYRDRLFSIEKIQLTDHADTVLIGPDSGVLLKSLQEIDAGGNAVDEKDILDFSTFDGALTVVHGRLTGTDIDVQLKNFEEVIGSSSTDTFDFTGSSVTKVEGAQETMSSLAEIPMQFCSEAKEMIPLQQEAREAF
jgi:hypothetical protein